MNNADLVVAGAGPAGLAAAIHAARAGLDVVVIEPRPSGPIDKACGEGIMPGGVEALERLGVRPRGRPFVGIRYSDAFAVERTATGTFGRGTALGVRRTELQGALLEAALSAGVSIVRGRVTKPDGAKWLIGADGLRSRVREAIGVALPPRRPQRLGLRRHYRVAPWSDRVEVYFAPGAEAYVTPVDDDLVGVAVLFRSDNATSFDALLRGFPLLAARLPAGAATWTRGAGPFEQRVSRPASGNVLLIGDAAGYLDPLTGEGIALGLATAEAAVAAITQGGDVAAVYTAAYRRLTADYFALTSALLHVAHRRWLHRPLLTAARAFPAVFDWVLGHLGHLPARGE